MFGVEVAQSTLATHLAIPATWRPTFARAEWSLREWIVNPERWLEDLNDLTDVGCVAIVDEYPIEWRGSFFSMPGRDWVEVFQGFGCNGSIPEEVDLKLNFLGMGPWCRVVGNLAVTGHAILEPYDQMVVQPSRIDGHHTLYRNQGFAQFLDLVPRGSSPGPFIPSEMFSCLDENTVEALRALEPLIADIRAILAESTAQHDDLLVQINDRLCNLELLSKTSPPAKRRMISSLTWIRDAVLVAVATNLIASSLWDAHSDRIQHAIREVIRLLGG